VRYLSVCSGIETASLAWEPLGWTPHAFSEIDPYACAYLDHYYPNVPNLGDMTKYGDWNESDIDVLVGGTPCQSYSIAGLRKGLDDPRGDLMLTFGAIADKYRSRWVVWENVPGALSTNGGRDFGTFLGMLAELGYGFAYRILNAQFFGVPQRRRRAFVVGYLGDWRRAAAVLFERESLQGHTAPSRKTRKGDSAGTEKGTRGDNRKGISSISLALSTRNNRFDLESQTFIPSAFALRGRESGAVAEFAKGDYAHALRATTGGSSRDIICFSENSRAELRTHEVSSSISSSGSGKTGQGRPAICFSNTAGNTNLGIKGDGMAPPITRRNGDPGNACLHGYVRRLTPLECERLQGIPDDRTLIPYRGKLASDTARYKAIGNAMAVPVMRWLGKRIDLIENLSKQ